MSRTAREEPVGPSRNKVARAALVTALVFLVQPVSVLIYYLFLHMGFKSLDVTHPTHPLAGLVSAISVSSVLCLRVDFFVGLPALILGGVGLRAARRQPGRAGRREAVAAIVLGLLAPLVTVGNYFFMAADWRQ